MSQPLVIDQVYALVMDAILPPDFAPRSPGWHRVREAHIEKHPTCAACGKDMHLEVHHIKPYHIYPGLELDTYNLITLCNHPARLCHFRIGHGFDWHRYNPNVIVDASYSLMRLGQMKG